MKRPEILLILFVVLMAACTQTSESENPKDVEEASTTVAKVIVETDDGMSPKRQYDDAQQVGILSNQRSDEAFLTSGDLNNDGLEDIVVTRTTFLTFDTFEIEILLNLGNGKFSLETKDLFEGKIPEMQNPTDVLIADFNNDGYSDIFIADHGYDETPHPGFQNILVLSTGNGKFVDASDKLPQQKDFSHSATAADVDADGDLDIFVGNFNGEKNISPYLMLNEKGSFSNAENALPNMIKLEYNHYTDCEFGDVNNDGFPDLILGGGHGSDSLVLLNDSNGMFDPVMGSLPKKEYSDDDQSHEIVLFDINNDGFLDIFMEYEMPYGVSYIQALINDQTGSFEKRVSEIIGSLSREESLPDFELRDLNHDGEIDLQAFPWNWENPTPLVFINNGAGVFTEQDHFNIRFPNLYFTFLDIDGDLGNDIVYWEDNRLFLLKENH